MKMVNTDADWSKEVSDAGDKVMCIIDVYTSSWGPSEMIAGHCQSWYFDLGEKFGIKFVRAQSDNISALKDYKGRAQSAFVFYINGEKKKELEGPDIPAILKMIKEEAPKVEG